MKLPNYCYQKAFWILLGIFVTIVFSTTGLIYGQMAADIERNNLAVISNDLELSLIQQKTEKLDEIYENQILICIKLGVNCK